MTQYNIIRAATMRTHYVPGPVLDDFSVLRPWQQRPLLWLWQFGGPGLAFLQPCAFSTRRGVHRAMGSCPPTGASSSTPTMNKPPGIPEFCLDSPQPASRTCPCPPQLLRAREVARAWLCCFGYPHSVKGRGRAREPRPRGWPSFCPDIPL